MLRRLLRLQPIAVVSATSGAPLHIRHGVRHSHDGTKTTTTAASSSSTTISDRQRELMARSLPKRAPLAGVQHIVVVASGKGGVGKSTTACKAILYTRLYLIDYDSGNLAVALAARGLRVGLLDADIFGPSVPLMMNVHEEPLVNDANQMIPPVNYNVKWCAKSI